MAGSISSVLVIFTGIFTLIPLLGIIGLAITFVVAYIVQVGTHTLLNKKFPYVSKNNWNEMYYKSSNSGISFFSISPYQPSSSE